MLNPLKVLIIKNWKEDDITKIINNNRDNNRDNNNNNENNNNENNNINEINNKKSNHSIFKKDFSVQYKESENNDWKYYFSAKKELNNIIIDEKRPQLANLMENYENLNNKKINN